MTHDIPREIRNSDILRCISEYVRLVDHRRILRDKWFRGMTLDELAQKYHYSTTTIKEILYGEGDAVITLAARENN